METETRNPTVSEIIRSYPFRLGVYAAITLVLFQAIYAAIVTYGAAWLASEQGPLESTQVALVLVAAVSTFLAARWATRGRATLVVAAAMMTYAAARESDLLFETYLFDDAYKWLVGIPMLILVLAVVIAERRRLLADTMWWMRQPPATLFIVAGVFLCFVCQNLDRSGMWLGLGQNPGVHISKALIEEYAELFAYLLLAFSGIEAAIVAMGDRAGAEQQHVSVADKSPRAYRVAS